MSKTRYIVNKTKLLTILIISVVLILWIISVPSMSNHNQIKSNAERALTALMQNEEKLWQSFIHPVSGTDIMDIEIIQKELTTVGLDLRNGFSIEKSSSSSYADRDAMEMELRIESRNEIFRITFIYLSDDTGSGFTHFKVVDAFP